MKKTLLAATTMLMFCFTALAEDKPGKPGPAGGRGGPGAKRPGGPGGAGGGQMLVRIFDKADANGDGKLSKEELTKALENGPGGRIKDNPQIIDMMFNRLDADKDGQISKDEMQKAGGQLQGRRPGGKPGERKPGEKKPE